LVASGNFLMDDLVVSTNKSFYALVPSSIRYGGSISPSGPVVVSPGSTNTFNMAASNWYNLASVVVDGAVIGTPASYTFSNVQSDHTIAANYTAQLAVNNTPKWWLYQQNTNWAANFDAAALGDQDGDGMPTWQEYIAGTDPQNPASVFALSATQGNGSMAVSFPTVAPTAQYQLQRYYSIQSSTNLADPLSWHGIAGWTNIQGQGQNLLYTNATGSTNIYFRGQVWLAP
jgi:hypothetical protein